MNSSFLNFYNLSFFNFLTKELVSLLKKGSLNLNEGVSGRILRFFAGEIIIIASMI